MIPYLFWLMVVGLVAVMSSVITYKTWDKGRVVTYETAYGGRRTDPSGKFYIPLVLGVVFAIVWTVVACAHHPVVEDFHKEIPLRAVGNGETHSASGAFFLFMGTYGEKNEKYYYYMAWDEAQDGWRVGKENVEDAVIVPLEPGEEPYIRVHCEAERWVLFGHTEKPECNGFNDYYTTEIHVPDDAITTDVSVELPE